MADKSIQQTSQVMEHLETRLLMRAPRPVQIMTAFLDNRGQASFTVSVALNTATLTRKSATILTAGVDGVLGTADDARVSTSVAYRKGRLTLTANLPVNTKYRVRLSSGGIRDVNGLALDGEYKSGKPSGNGIAGGNYDVVSATPAATRVRFTTVAGYINVGLYKNTPITKANFLHYANEAAWDGTFFHRSEHHHTGGNDLDVLQGGGFNLINNVLGSVHMENAIDVEGTNSNLQGTIAMARLSARNSNTNEWFFNTKPNTVLDGDYTVFGAVLDAESLKTITAINNFTIIDATTLNTPIASALGEFPVTRSTATVQNLLVSDVSLVTRVAQLFGVVATPNVQAHTVSAAANASAAVMAPARATPFLVTAPTKNSVLDDEA